MAKFNNAIVFGIVLIFASAFAASDSGACEADVEECNPNYSSFLNHGGKTVENDLRKYTSQLVDKSYRFLVLSSVFNKYSLDRPGFEKLYRKFSDKAWADAIDLIKYQSRRGSFGYLVNPKSSEQVSNEQAKILSRPGNYSTVLDVNELSSLQFALEYEKALAQEAHAIHRKVSHAAHKAGGGDYYHYDPDAAHYLDENIIEYQSGTVRDLAGYIHNLKHFSRNSQGASDLGVHLFDEFLAKAE
ncbi:ferritin light chain-like protein precursor [Anopheles darlingi]|uniref:Ferritin n=1 Tax=Anopheles darlingi TaxID=43151 RepID=W5JM75_ANODA|nr:soma ferritin [Anopheles darlingi]ETN64000.1 ferritin light chain-like protein precursor [Anopheles darlingi]